MLIRCLKLFEHLVDSIEFFLRHSMLRLGVSDGISHMLMNSIFKLVERICLLCQFLVVYLSRLPNCTLFLLELAHRGLPLVIIRVLCHTTLRT